MAKKFTPPCPEQLNLFDTGLLAEPEVVLPATYGARHNDPPTSAQALDSATLGRQGNLRRKLLQALYTASDGFTYEEAAEAAGVTFQACPWKRLQELTCLGWLEVCGTREGPTTHKQQQVYRFTGQGMAAWKAEASHG